MGVMLQMAVGVVGGADPAIDAGKAIDDARKSEVLQTVATSLRDGYVFADKGDQLANIVWRKKSSR